MPTRRTTLLLDADLLERLERHARQTRRTKTAIVAAALEAYLAEHAERPTFGFIAVGRSGHGRLSLDARAILRRELGGSPGGRR